MYSTLSSSTTSPHLILFENKDPTTNKSGEEETEGSEKQNLQQTQKSSNATTANDSTSSSSAAIFRVPPSLGRILGAVAPRTKAVRARNSIFSSDQERNQYYLRKVQNLLSSLQQRKHAKNDKNMFVNLDDEENNNGGGNSSAVAKKGIWLSTNTFRRGPGEKQLQRQREQEAKREAEKLKRNKKVNSNKTKKGELLNPLKPKKEIFPRKLTKRKNRLSKKRRDVIKKAKKKRFLDQQKENENSAVAAGKKKNTNKVSTSTTANNNPLSRVSKNSVFRKIIKGNQRKNLSGKLEKCMRCSRRTKRLVIHAQNQLFVKANVEFLRNDFIPAAKGYCRDLMKVRHYHHHSQTIVKRKDKEETGDENSQMKMLKRLLSHPSKICSLVGMKVFVELLSSDENFIVSGVIVEHVRKVSIGQSKDKYVSILVDGDSHHQMYIVLYKERTNRRVMCCNDQASKSFISNFGDNENEPKVVVVRPYERSKVKFCCVVVDEEKSNNSGLMELSEELLF